MEIFDWNRYNTDKNMSGHGYNFAYDYFIGSNRNDVLKVVEIGTRTGSINLWLDYFPKCTLYGIDLINPNYISDRFVFEKIDQGDNSSWHNFIIKHDNEFDVIIDDGPHTTPEQLISFNILFDRLKSGGVYIIEDLHCTEPYCIDSYKNKKGMNYSMLDLLKDFKNSIFTKTEYLSNIDNIKNSIKNITIVKGENNRWPSHMSEPSEIAFVFKK